MTAPVPESPWRNKRLIALAALLVSGVLLIGGLFAGNYYLTLHASAQTARQVATAIEKARDIAAAKAAAAELATSLRTCNALHGLAEIKGSHVAAATYGYHLQTGIANVYAQSGCPQLLKRYGPRHPSITPAKGAK